MSDVINSLWHYNKPWDLKTILSWVLSFSGETGAGKTTLVAKLQGVEEYMKGRGLEYMYFNVLDDDIDGKDCLSWTSF